jgi:hypothetical protein
MALHLDELDSYTEGLYEEDLAKRAAAAGMICQLFRNTAHLEVGQYCGRDGNGEVRNCPR